MRTPRNRRQRPKLAIGERRLSESSRQVFTANKPLGVAAYLDYAGRVKAIELATQEGFTLEKFRQAEET